MKKAIALLVTTIIAAYAFSGCASMKFQDAIQSGNVAEVEALLAEGQFGVNDRISFGRTPLYLAVEGEKHDMAAFLLEQGADVDIKTNAGDAPLVRAARSGQDDMVRLLLEAGGDPSIQGEEGMTALMHYVGRAGGMDIIELLVENGADLNTRNDRSHTRRAMDIAMNRQSNIPAVYYLIKQGATVTEGALFSALNRDKQLAMHMLEHMSYVPSSALLAVLDDHELFNKLIDRGADPTPALGGAVRTGNTKAVRQLVAAGGDINSHTDLLERAANADMARVLVELGVNVEIGLPVHQAVMDEDAERIHFLVTEAGISLDRLDHNGQTAVHLAAWHQKFNMLKALLETSGPYYLNLQDGANEATVLDYIGTGNETHVPESWKTEYKEITRQEVREMLVHLGAVRSIQL